MPIITLTTDWKTNDYYVGAIKGKILSECPGTTIIDITHQVPSFNINQAAFIIRNCYYNYPPGSIHLIAVNSEGGKDEPFLAVSYDKHYLLTTDNGILGLICSDPPDQVVRIDAVGDNYSFTGVSVFADAACRLAAGEAITALGTEVKEYKKKIPIRAAIEESVINGSIIYIDSFRNAISNISKDLFERIGKGRNFEIYVQSNHYRINRINRLYNETSPGEILAIFNSIGLLEVAINNGNAADLLNLSVNSGIRIKFTGKNQGSDQPV